VKLGIVGKGGVGKTTVAAIVARTLADRGARVIAVDTDSNPNLGLSLGLDLAATDAIPVLPRALIVGRGGDVTADELVASYGRRTPAGVTLLSAIRVAEAGAGCTCAGHGTVRSFLGEALDTGADVTVVDMEAGLEHLSRSGGTLAHADVLLVVMEPSRKSVLTAARTQQLARELGIPRVLGVGNKAQHDEDQVFLRDACEEAGIRLAAILPYTPVIRDQDRADGDGVSEVPSEVRSEVERILDQLDAAGVG
jgi:CO dehydrogenase maturation factor